MTHNPYKPPQADVSRPPVARGSLAKAVSIGVLVDIVGTIVISFAGSLLFGFYLVMQGLTPGQMESYLAGIAPTSAFTLVFTALGMLMSVVAGYISARIVRHNEYQTALLVGILSSLIGLLISFGYYSPWLSLAAVGTTLAAVMLGAWLFVRTKKTVVSESD